MIVGISVLKIGLPDCDTWLTISITFALIYLGSDKNK